MHRQRGWAVGGMGNFRMHGSSRSSASYSARTRRRYCFLRREQAGKDLQGQGSLSSHSRELKSEIVGQGITHEALVGLLRLQACISSEVSGSTRRAPEDREPSISCPEYSSHIIPPKWASPSAVHATLRIALVSKLLSLSFKRHPSTPGSTNPLSSLTAGFLLDSY